MNAIATAFVVSVFAGCSVVIFRSEWEGLSPRLASWLKRKAVGMAPIDLRERLDEEWASVLSDMPTPLSKLFTALGFCVAGCKMRVAPGQTKKRFSSRALKLLLKNPAVRTAPIVGVVCAIVDKLVSGLELPAIKVGLGWAQTKVDVSSAAVLIVMICSAATIRRSLAKYVREVTAEFKKNGLPSDESAFDR